MIDLSLIAGTGPFDGMACCFDDGTRFVAGMVATPLISYYDATLDAAFLNETLVPYLSGVADFYTSYAVLNPSTAKYDIPYTCAQEICSPSGELHNAHQDVAYARMAYTRLLNFTEPGSIHAHALDLQQRSGMDRTVSRAVWRKVSDKFMNFVLQMMNFVLQMMDFVLTMMDFVLKIMNFVLKMMDFVLKIMNFVFKMMDWRKMLDGLAGLYLQ